MTPQMIPSERGSGLVAGRARGGRRRLLLLAAATLVCPVFAPAARADTIQVTGPIALPPGEASNWSNPAIWSTAPLVPNNGNGGYNYDVQLGDGTVTLDMDVVINGFTHGHDATLNGSGVLTVNGMLDWATGTIQGNRM